MKLTESVVLKLPFEPDKQRVIRDDALPGHLVVIGKTTKTYTIQGDLRQNGRRVKTIKMAIGRVGEITLKDARLDAKDKLGQIRRCIDPSQPNRARLTLRVAWERYKRGITNANTLRLYTHCIEVLLKDWLDRPMAESGNDLTGADRCHQKITKKNGPVMANTTMKTLRAVYRHSRRRMDRTLPEHPVEGVDFNKERRCSTALRPELLPTWERQRQALSNPVRRELHLFVLLSGMRPGATAAARWEHLNVKGRTLHVPAPKGGEDRAFDLPLSRPMLRCLWRARKVGRIMHPKEARTWIFPAASESGHIFSTKEPRSVLSHWGGDLRQTWVSPRRSRRRDEDHPEADREPLGQRRRA